MTNLFQPGEKIVAAAPLRDKVLIIGGYGTVVMAHWNDMTDSLEFQLVAR